MKTRRHNYSEDHLPRQNKRGKTSENGGENALPIPIDLVLEIFSRLPVKSIARCRCVSKIWSSMLRRREFRELFLSKSSTHPQLLFACQIGRELFVYLSPQLQNPVKNSPPIIPKYRMSFFFNGCYEINSVVNGLLCVIRNKKLSDGSGESVPVICNTSTGESKNLKKVKTRSDRVKNLVGCDPIDKGFKFLSITIADSLVDEEEHQVLTLGTSKWRKIEARPGNNRYPSKELCVNGVLYYHTNYLSERINAICCFDIRSEKFNIIEVNERLPWSALINYNGKLGVLWSGTATGDFNRTSPDLKLWILEDVERQEWSKRIIVLPPMWKHVVGDLGLSVVGVIGTNEFVFDVSYPFFHPLYLFYLNTDKNTIVRVKVQGMDRYKSAGVHIFLNHVEDVKRV